MPYLYLRPYQFPVKLSDIAIEQNNLAAQLDSLEWYYRIDVAR